jgi:hypothetical protein
MNHKKRSLLRPAMSRYEQFIFLFNTLGSARSKT